MGTSLKVLEPGRGFESCVWTFLWGKQVQVPSSRGKSLMGVSHIPDEYFNYWPGHREEWGSRTLLLSPVLLTEVINPSWAPDQVQALGVQSHHL